MPSTPLQKPPWRVWRPDSTNRAARRVTRKRKAPAVRQGAGACSSRHSHRSGGLPLAHTDTGDRAARPYSPRARPTPVTIGNAGCLCPVHRVTAQRRVRRIALRADSARPEQGSQIGLVTTRGDEAIRRKLMPAWRSSSAMTAANYKGEGRCGRIEERPARHSSNAPAPFA